MIQEMLPILCQVYGARAITRSYPLHRSIHLGQAKVTPAFAAVLHMLQATVSCASGLACLNPLSPPPVTSASASTTAESLTQGQGKKGKNKGKPSTLATPTSSTSLVVDSAEVSKMALADVQVRRLATTLT